jgi:hypothetical protein
VYEINCEDCGTVGFHASRVGAESQAERHAEETGHDTSVEAQMDA